jgi:hypothetical protein
MVYDFTADSPILHAAHGEPGYAIYKGEPFSANAFAVFTDDGRGNGDLVCNCSNLYWARRIALALDLVADRIFGQDGNLR